MRRLLQHHGALLAAILVLALALLLSTLPFPLLSTIRASQARKHVGEVKTVCGSVESAHHENRGPTFLNLGRKYPYQEFTIIIWSEYRSPFPQPEIFYLNEKICAKGRIQLYRGTPEISVESPNLIQTMGTGALEARNTILVSVASTIFALLLEAWHRRQPWSTGSPSAPDSGASTPPTPPPPGTVWTRLRKWPSRHWRTALFVLVAALAVALLAVAVTWLAWR